VKEGECLDAGYNYLVMVEDNCQVDEGFLEGGDLYLEESCLQMI